MKCRTAITLFFAALLMSATTAAPQTQNPRKGAEKTGTSEQKDPLVFVRIAADVAANVQHDSLNNFLALYIAPENWDAASKDGDLGPLMKVKESKAGRSAACLFSPSKDAAVCVFFDGDTPFGMTAVKAGSSGKIEAADAAAAYKSVSKEMLKPGDQKLQFTPGDVATDDGQRLAGFLITTQ
jgi:hypothetical protein